MVIVVVKLAVGMSSLVHRKQFYVWFLGNITYTCGWLDTYNSSEGPAVKGLNTKIINKLVNIYIINAVCI